MSTTTASSNLTPLKRDSAETSALIPAGVTTNPAHLEPPAASVGIAILRTWAGCRLERYCKGSEAAKGYARRVLEALPEAEAETFLFSQVIFPALQGLARDRRIRDAGRLIDFAACLSVSDNRRRINETASGQAFLAELREGLASYG